jgi:hypothetical protein
MVLTRKEKRTRFSPAAADGAGQGECALSVIECMSQAFLMLKYMTVLNMGMGLERFLICFLAKVQRPPEMLPGFLEAAKPMEDTAQAVMYVSLPLPAAHVLRGGKSRAQGLEAVMPVAPTIEVLLEHDWKLPGMSVPSTRNRQPDHVHENGVFDLEPRPGRVGTSEGLRHDTSPEWCLHCQIHARMKKSSCRMGGEEIVVQHPVDGCVPFRR